MNSLMPFSCIQVQMKKKKKALGSQPIICVVWHRDSCCFLRKTHPGLPRHQGASGSWTIPTDRCLLLTSRCSPRLCPYAGPDRPRETDREEAITGLMISAVTTDADFCAVEISRKVKVQQNVKISECRYVRAWGLLFPKQESAAVLTEQHVCEAPSVVCVLAVQIYYQDSPVGEKWIH